MKAYLHATRIAPKKANLVAKMVRGMPVPEAMKALKHTNKKAARLIEELLKSAVANAQHNDKQDGGALVIKTIVVNQGTHYQRGVPMARGRMRPIKKFLSHISLTLGIADEEGVKSEKKKSTKTSQKAKTTVKKSTPKKNTSKDSSESSDSSTSPSSAS